MLISHKYKFITIDIPKTGTRSFRETLVPLNIIDVIGKAVDPNFPQHGTAMQCKKSLKKIGLNYINYFSFCVVRNPWKRYFSFFTYFKQQRDEYFEDSSMKLLKKQFINGIPPEYVGQINYVKSLFTDSDDKEVLEKIILSKPNQSQYFLDDGNNIMVNEIAKFENLKEGYLSFCKKIGITPPELKHKNKSTYSSNINTIYNQKLIDLVSEKEKYIIDLKNYSF